MDQSGYGRAAAAGLTVAALLLGGCAAGQTAGSPTPSQASADPGAPTSAVRPDMACALLRPEQVQEVIGRGPVTTVPGTVGTAQFQSCFYQSGRQTLLDLGLATGWIGNDGRAAVTSAAEGRADGAVSSIDGLAAGAAYYRLKGGGGAISLALDSGGELTIVTLQGDLGRDVLVALARKVDENA